LPQCAGATTAPAAATGDVPAAGGAQRDTSDLPADTLAELFGLFGKASHRLISRPSVSLAEDNDYRALTPPPADPPAVGFFAR
jgi:hypothetical protein